jgi:site-specific DNA-methyltransferase (adenine-specific)
MSDATLKPAQGPANEAPKKRREFTSTVGRGKAIVREQAPDTDFYKDDLVQVHFGDSLKFYDQWDTPQCIVSDGAYGVLGFEGDTSDHTGMPEWYEPHVQAWSKRSTPQTTLWFWNSEIGWAAVHPVLEKHGWRYVNANIWDKGVGHIAGNVNTTKIRRFPVVSEVCVQYVKEARIDGQLLKHWLLKEWKRTGLPVREANKACGVADAAVRKYLDQGHLWYWMPVDMFEKMAAYANRHGKPEGRPYFSKDGKRSMTGEDWAKTRSRFNCPHGMTNVWQRNAVRGTERIKTHGTEGRAVHLNQKPLDLMTRIVEATTNEGETIWEPFGGLFTGCVAARRLGRRAFSAEIDGTYFHYGLERLISEASQRRHEQQRRDECPGCAGSRRRVRVGAQIFAGLE